MSRNVSRPWNHDSDCSLIINSKNRVIGVYLHIINNAHTCAFLTTSNLTLADLCAHLWTHIHTFKTFNSPYSGTTRVSRYQKGKPIWIFLKQETVSSSGISWARWKSPPRSRQITTPALHHSVFYRPDALPAIQPAVSKQWRPMHIYEQYLLTQMVQTTRTWRTDRTESSSVGMAAEVATSRECLWEPAAGRHGDDNRTDGDRGTSAATAALLHFVRQLTDLHNNNKLLHTRAAPYD